ncbi:seizure protein 6 homolog isoform X1, partial [Tachysurus ichikawai]
LSTDFSTEGTDTAIAVMLPAAVVLLVILGIFLYFSKVQGKTTHLSSSSSLPYDSMSEEPAFDNPVFETRVSMDTVNLRDVDSLNTAVLS